MCTVDTIDAELRLPAAVHQQCREDYGVIPPTTWRTHCWTNAMRVVAQVRVRGMSYRTVAAIGAILWGLGIFLTLFVALPLWLGVSGMSLATLIVGALGAAGSFAAAAVALGIAINTNKRQDRKEDEERENAKARALRRARRTAVKGDRYDTQSRESRFLLDRGPQDAYHLELHNTGIHPIYGVTWSPPLVVYLPYTPPGQQIPLKFAWIDNAQLMRPLSDEDDVPAAREMVDIVDIDPFVLAPDDGVEIRVEIPNMPEGVSKEPIPLTVYNRVSYEDKDGYRFGWVYRQIDKTADITGANSVRGEWALVDDLYPDNVDDAIRKLVEKAPPRPGTGAV
jgi:hypothetical protein